MLQRSKRAHPFCTHVDKLKPYEADVMPASWLQRTADDASPNTDDADASSDGNQDDRTAPVGVVVRTQQGDSPDDSPNPQNSDGACIPSDVAIAGAPPINFHSPRPQRYIRPPRRYVES